MIFETLWSSFFALGISKGARAPKNDLFLENIGSITGALIGTQIQKKLFEEKNSKVLFTHPFKYTLK